MSGDLGFEEDFYHFLIDGNGSLGLHGLESNVVCAEHLLSFLESGIWVHAWQRVPVWPAPVPVLGSAALVSCPSEQRCPEQPGG